MRRVIAIALLLAAGVGAKRHVGPVTWRAVATADDRERLRGWRDTWLEALGRARAAGAGATIATEGALFDPDGALPGPVPPPGAYRCRLFLFGGIARELTATPPFACLAGPGGVRFARLGGQRVTGQLYADAENRAIFLGTVVFADERRVPRYGRDSGRDLAGLMERVADRRWRLTLPRPRFEALLDVIEIVPAS